MENWISYLEGGDLRSIANVDQLVPLIQSQSDFDQLFQYLNSEKRLVVMRAADAVEKISQKHPEFLDKHKGAMLQHLQTATDKEFKWHLVLMVSRLKLSSSELTEVWEMLSKLAKDSKESRIVRVNSIQSLFDLTRHHKAYESKFQELSKQLQSEAIPSINARLKKLKLH